MPQRTTAPGFSEDASAWELARRLCVYLGRGARLRCPECGVSPVFVPLSRTHSLRDWFTPLDGCPRCGYAYEREDGYFLLATWGVHYFAVAGFGLATGLLIDWLFSVSFVALICGVGLATVAFGFLFVRHAKSFYIAADHYFDPHVKPNAGPDESTDRAPRPRR